MTNGKVLVVRDTQGASHSQTDLTDGRIHGEIVQGPIVEAPGQTRIGRKDQHGSLLTFIDEPVSMTWESLTGRAPRTLLQFSRRSRTMKISQMAWTWLTSTTLLMRSGAPDCKVFVNRTSTDRSRLRRFPVAILLLPGIKATRASYQL
jgi:hypothetical protein